MGLKSGRVNSFLVCCTNTARQLVDFGKCLVLTCKLFLNGTRDIYIEIDPVGACFFEGISCGEPHVFMPCTLSVHVALG